MKRKAFMTLVGKVYNKKAVEDLADNDLKLSDENSADDAELDDDEVNKVLTALDGEKVGAIKKTQFDTGFKKGEATKAKALETKLRETFEIDDATLQGEELINHIKENLPEGAIPADITKLTEEEAAKIPAVKRIIQGHKKALTDLTNQHTTELESERSKQGENETFADVAKKAAARLTREGFKVNLPEDAAKRDARIEKLLNSELKGVKWQKQTDGSYIPVDKEGVQLEDTNGNPINFDTFVDGIIDSNFDFEVATPDPESPGNKNKPPLKEGAKKYVGKKPTSENEYMEMLVGTELDTDEKTALREAYADQDW